MSFLHRALPFALACILAVSAGCVTREHREHETVRDEYRACVDDKGPDHEECQDLKAKLAEIQRRYEQRSREAWNCQTSSEECPRRR